MARRSRSRKRRDWRQMAFYAITLLIALSMVLSYVLIAIR